MSSKDGALTLKVLKLFLASPSDTGGERKIVRKVVGNWNQSVGIKRGLHIEVVGWETHTSPEYGDRPQGIVNRQLGQMRQYALFIGILRHRFGLPTGKADSGTEEEFKRAAKAWETHQKPDIKFYYCKASFNPKTAADADQKRKVMAFRERIMPLSIGYSYGTLAEFQTGFTQHFHQWVEEQLSARPKLKPKPKSPKAEPQPPELKPPKSKAPKSKAPAPQTPKALTGKKPPASTSETPAKETRRAPAPKSPKTPPPKAKAAPLKKRRDSGASATVSAADVDGWVMLDGHIFRRKRKRGAQGNQLTLEIEPRDGEDRSALRRLCDSQRYGSFSYAHGADAGRVRIDSCEDESQDEGTVWTLKATLDRSSGRSWMPEQAQKQAATLLLGPSHNPNPRSGSGASLHAGFYDSFFEASRSQSRSPGLFETLWAQMSGDQSQFLRAAFLHAVHKLKSEGLCDDVIELKLGPIKDGVLRVHFKGRISSSYMGTATTIEVDGDCPLSPPKEQQLLD